MDRRGGTLSYLNPRDSLRLASKIERLGPLVKASLALPTIKGSLAGQPGTPLAARSGPQLITSMLFHVPSQVGRPAEGAPTLPALEGPLSSMEPLVANEL